MKLSLIGNQVLIILFMILIGVYSRRKNIINEDFNKGLSSLLLNITLPMYIISAFNVQYSKALLVNMLIIFFFGLIIHPVSFYLGKVFFLKYKGRNKDIIIFCTIFSNCGFMAFPILDSLYGKIGVLYGSAFLAPFNLFLWTLGIRLYETKKSIFNIRNVVNPGVIAVIAGVFLLIISIKLPYFVFKTFEIVGSMTTPISMIITGVIIARLRIIDLVSSASLYYLAFIRLLVIPLLSLILLRTLGIEGTAVGVCVLIAGMPSAAMATVFAEQFDKEKEFSSIAVFITTILSLITLPLLIIILSYLYG